MSDVKIDTQTGLPELPEGYFWRVEAWRIDIVRKDPGSDWTEWIPGNLSPVKTQTLEIQQRGFWRKQFRERRFASEMRVFGHYYGEPRNFYPDPKDEQLVSRSNLPERAKAVYLDWQRWKDDQAVYGIYPPKKLGDA